MSTDNKEKQSSDFSIYLDEESYDNSPVVDEKPETKKKKKVKAKSKAKSKVKEKEPDIAEETVNEEKTDNEEILDNTDVIEEEKSDEEKTEDAETITTESNDEAEIVSKKEKGLKAWWKRRTGFQKTLMIIFLVVVLMIAGTGIYVWSKLEMIDTKGDENFVATEEEEDFDASQMDSITDAVSLNDLLMKWATNGGEKLHSKYVTNILLIGKDSTSSLADSMILVSVNETTKQLSMVSFYRDSYTYIAPTGKTPGYGKLNSAYSKGGPRCLIETIENNYKIVIDDYALVDYNSFPKIINALGGVDVSVTAREANYINKTWKNWTRTGIKPNFYAGVNHLNGDDALMFCRVRKLDSDIGRTERQRRVMTSIMNRFKNASLGQINSAINALLPNINTGMSKTEILGYAADAVSSGWLSFPMNQTTMPTLDTSKGGFVGDQWVWICDYEGAAYQLQMLLYGKSNISMSPDRVSPVKVKPTSTTQRVVNKVSTTAGTSMVTSKVSITMNSNNSTTKSTKVENTQSTTTTKPITTKVSTTSATTAAAGESTTAQ